MQKALEMWVIFNLFLLKRRDVCHMTNQISMYCSFVSIGECGIWYGSLPKTLPSFLYEAEAEAESWWRAFCFCFNSLFINGWFDMYTFRACASRYQKWVCIYYTSDLRWLKFSFDPPLFLVPGTRHYHCFLSLCSLSWGKYTFFITLGLDTEHACERDTEIQTIVLTYNLLFTNFLAVMHRSSLPSLQSMGFHGNYVSGKKISWQNLCRQASQTIWKFLLLFHFLTTQCVLRRSLWSLSQTFYKKGLAPWYAL